MNIHNATEIAYKNGYEQAKKDFLSAIEIWEKQALANTQNPKLNNTYYAGKYTAFHKVAELIRRKGKQ